MSKQTTPTAIGNEKPKDNEILIDNSPSNHDKLTAGQEVKANDPKNLAKEINGPKGLEPTRYGDWESKGRCYDF